MPLAPLLTSTALEPVELDGDIAVSVGLEGNIQVGDPLSLGCDLAIAVGLEGGLEIIHAVELDCDLGIAIGTDGELYVEAEMGGDLELRIGMEGELLIIPASIELDGSMGLGIGISGVLALGTPLPATDWSAVTPVVDPEILQSMRVKLATRDGEYTIVDPKELSDLVVDLTRKGGVDTGSMTLLRDSREELGDLDYGTACTIEYMGRTWELFVSEASLSHDSGAMSRPVTLLGYIMRLKVEHEAFRRVYVCCDLDMWETGQGQSTSSQVFEVSATGSGD